MVQLLTPETRHTPAIVPLPRWCDAVAVQATGDRAQYWLFLWGSTAMWTSMRTAADPRAEICRCPRCRWGLLGSSCSPSCCREQFLLVAS